MEIKKIKFADGIKINFTRDITIPAEAGSYLRLVRSEKSDFTEEAVTPPLYSNKKIDITSAANSVVITDTFTLPYDGNKVFYYKLENYTETARTTLLGVTETITYVPQVEGLSFSLVNGTSLKLSFTEITSTKSLEYVIFHTTTDGVNTKIAGDDSGNNFTGTSPTKEFTVASTAFNFGDTFSVLAFTGPVSTSGALVFDTTLGYETIFVGLNGTPGEDYARVSVGKANVIGLITAYDSVVNKITVTFNKSAAAESYKILMKTDGITDYTDLGNVTWTSGATVSKEFISGNIYNTHTVTFNPGQTFYFKVVADSILTDAQYNGSAVVSKTIPVSGASVKKIIDLTLGKIEVNNSFEGLLLNTNRGASYGRLPLMFIKSSVMGSVLFPKLIKNKTDILSLIEKIMSNPDKTTLAASLNTVEKRTEMFTLIKTLKMLALNVDTEYYLTISDVSFNTAFAKDTDLEEEILKKKDIKFIFNLSDIDSAATALAINGKLAPLNIIYVTTDEAGFASQYSLSGKITLGNYALSSAELPVQIKMKPSLSSPYATDYNMDNVAGVSNNYFFIPTTDLFTETDISDLKTLLTIESGITNYRSTDFYASKILLETKQIVFPILANLFAKQYNGETANQIIAWIPITSTSVFGLTSVIKPMLHISGLGEMNKYILDDYCGYHMTGVVNVDGNLNMLVLKNEHDYLKKFPHIQLAVLKLQELVYSFLEEQAIQNRIKEKNVPFISLGVKGIMENEKSKKLFYAFELLKMAIEPVDDGAGGLKDSLVIAVKTTFELGLKKVVVTQKLYF